MFYFLDFLQPTELLHTSLFLLLVYSHVLAMLPLPFLHPEGNMEQLLRKERLSGMDARDDDAECIGRQNDNGRYCTLAFQIYSLLSRAIR